MAHRSIRIPEELEARIVERATSERRTFSAMAVLLLERALSEREPRGDPGVDRSATESALVEPSPSRSESDHFKPDPKPVKRK